MSGIGKPDDGPAKRPQPGFAARPGPRPGGSRPFSSGAFPSTTTARDVPTQNGVSGQPAQPSGQQPARPRGPGPSPGFRPMARPSSAGPANPSSGLTGRPQGGTIPAGQQPPPNLQRTPQPRPGGPVSRPTGPRGPLPGQQSQPAQANGLQFSQPGVFSGPARGPPSGGTPSQFQKPTPGGPQGFAPARPQNFGPPTQQRGSQPPISNNLPGPPPQPYNPFMRPGPGQPGPPFGGAPPGPMAPPVGPPVPSFGVSGPPMSNIPGTSQGPPAPFGPRPPSFGSANSTGMQGGGFQQQGGFHVQSSQKKLDPYESIPVNTGNAGQGMGPGNVQSPVEFQSLPRPLDEEDPAVRAPPLAHPRNCDSRYVRLTVSVIPKQQSMRSVYQMPIGAIVHPLADPQDIPIVSPDSPGIIRCRRCRTYINPFVVWQDGGRRFVCNVCAMTNDVPVEYYSALDHNGQRQDLDQRPELRGGSVEYIAPQEYMVRAPMPPVFFFVIDVSVTAINSGMVDTACAAIKESLDRLPGGDRTRIGFLTFDSNLHFYNLKSSLSQPQMMVVTEIEEPFVPQPDDLIVNLEESRGVVDALLTNLPQMFASSLSSEAATGPALKAAFLAMSSIGGKLLLFQAAVPSLGVGKIKNRDNPSMWNTEQEHKLRIPGDPFWKNYAAECSRMQIAVDIFSFSREYTDLASMGALPKYTCGQLYSYPSFTREKDGVKLSHEIVHNLTRTTGWEAVMRIRCSKGLRVSGFHGHFFVRSTDLLALPQVDPDKAFAVQIAHEENYVSAEVAYIQCALLYTSSSGERRIRVHTLMLPVVTEVADLYGTADGGAAATLVSKLAIEKTFQAKLEETRNAIQNKLVVAFKEYRKLYKDQGQSVGALPMNQLIFPPSLKYLPLWTLGLLKSSAVRGGARDVVLDERIAVGLDLMSASVPTMLRLLYPSLYAVHDPQGSWGTPNQDGRIGMPPRCPLFTDALYGNGAYLLDNGRIFVLWLGKEISPNFMSEVFGVDGQSRSPEQAPSLMLEPPRRSSQLSQRINAVVTQLRTGRPIYQKCFVVRQGSPQEHHVMPYFVEDRHSGQFSYQDFILTIHKQILSK